MSTVKEKVRCIHIDAKPGDPNTFWVGKSGKYYRRADYALKDDERLAVDPRKWAIKKNFFEQNKKALIICAICLVLALIVLKYFDMGKLVLNGKKW